MTSFLSLIFSLKQQKISKDLIIYLGKLILSMACSALLLAWPSPCYKPNSGICYKAKICSPCRLPQALQPVWEESVIWSLKTVWPPLLSLSLSLCSPRPNRDKRSVCSSESRLLVWHHLNLPHTWYSSLPQLSDQKNQWLDTLSPTFPHWPYMRWFMWWYNIKWKKLHSVYYALYSKVYIFSFFFFKNMYTPTWSTAKASDITVAE